LAAAALTGSLSKMKKKKLLIGLGVLPLLIGSHCVPQENATASKSVSLGTVEPYFRIESTIPERLKKSPFITQTAEGVDVVGIACVDKANGDTLMLTAQRGIDFSAKLERRAALYGYVNGIGRAFTTKGAKLTKITPKARPAHTK